MLLFLYIIWIEIHRCGMSFYRVKQFIWGFTSLFKDIDYNYVKEFLNEDEIKIFNKLKKSDKHHSIRVCRDSIEIGKKEDIDLYKLGKVALLHDVGKSERHLNLFEKSAVVLLDKFSNGKIKRYDKINQIHIYYNHSKIGAKMLKKYDYDKEFIDAIKYHHDKKRAEENRILKIISFCDDKN